jgi:Glutamine amidotransferase domain
MCGIVGFVRPEADRWESRRLQFLAQGLYADTLRGSCGTGVGTAGTGGIGVFKRALPGPDFLRSSMMERAEDAIKDANIVIGHNRAATIGTAVDSHAHPFHYEGEGGEILLVHNGTFHGYRNLVKEKSFNHAVDSAWAAKAISEKPAAEVLGQLDGPFVLVWYNRTLNTFNIARNNNREIYWVRAEGGGLYYASEFRMLDWLMDRNGIKRAGDPVRYQTLNEDEWCEWQLSSKFDIPENPEIKKIVKVYPQYAGRHPAWDGNFRGETTPWMEERDEGLKAFGTKMLEALHVEVKSWEPYQSSANSSVRPRYGRIHGVADSPSNKKIKNIPVIVDSVEESRYEYLKPIHEYLPVTVQGLCHGPAVPPETKGKPFAVRAELDNDAIIEYIKFAPDESVKKGPQKVHGGRKSNRPLPLIGPGLVTGQPSETDPKLVFVPSAFGTISLKAWRDKTAKGCSFCEEDIEERNFDKIFWDTKQVPAVPLCHRCSDDSGILKFLAAGITNIRDAVGDAPERTDAFGRKVGH